LSFINKNLDISTSRDQLFQYCNQFHLRCNLLFINKYRYRVMQIPEEKIMSAKERIEEPKAKTVEIQTVYR